MSSRLRTERQSCWVQLIFLAVSLFCSLQCTVDARRIDVNLTTSYLASPMAPIFETSEFLAEQDPAFFFLFASAVDIRLNAIVDKKSVNYTALSLDAARDVLPKGTALARLLPFVLLSRAHSPTVETFHQVEFAFSIFPLYSMYSLRENRPTKPADGTKMTKPVHGPSSRIVRGVQLMSCAKYRISRQTS